MANRSHDSKMARLLTALDGGASNVKLECGADAITVTHLDRVYWPAFPPLDQPAITKRAFLKYLIAVSTVMLRHLADRPLTIFRWPEGVEKRRVLQKHWEIALPPFVERVNIFSEAKGRDDEYIVCNNLATLIWLGHMGALELHVWHSRMRPGPDSANRNAVFSGSIENLDASILNFPDYLLFDLDPYIYSGNEKRGAEPELNAPAFEKVKEVAF